MGPLQIKEILQTAPENQSVVVKGWVRTKRESKNAIFIALNDGSTIHNIQAVAEPGQFSAELLLTVTTGSCLKVTGQLDRIARLGTDGRGKNYRHRSLRNGRS
jgi:asparaginyl-tRNA synthetase